MRTRKMLNFNKLKKMTTNQKIAAGTGVGASSIGAGYMASKLLRGKQNAAGATEDLAPTIANAKKLAQQNSENLSDISIGDIAKANIRNAMNTFGDF